MTTFYHASKVQLLPGTELRPVTRWGRGKLINDLLEEVMEDVRQEEFPERPSRLGAIFLCPALSICVREWTEDRPYVFEVEAEGNWFMTSGRTYNNIINRARKLWTKSPDVPDFISDRKLMKEIRRYWQGSAFVKAGDLNEVVLQGEAVVVQLRKIA